MVYVFQSYNRRFVGQPPGQSGLVQYVFTARLTNAQGSRMRHV